MPKPEWGTKRLCQSCGAKFYDFGRAEIVCPACGAPFDPEAATRTRRPARTEAPVEKTARARPIPAEEEEVALVVEEELEEGLEEELEEAALEEEPVEEEPIEEEPLPVEPAEEDEEADAAIIEDAGELTDEEEMGEVIEDELDDEEDR